MDRVRTYETGTAAWPFPSSWPSLPQAPGFVSGAGFARLGRREFYCKPLPSVHAPPRHGPAAAAIRPRLAALCLPVRAGIDQFAHQRGRIDARRQRERQLEGAAVE